MIMEILAQGPFGYSSSSNGDSRGIQHPDQLSILSESMAKLVCGLCAGERTRCELEFGWGDMSANQLDI